MISMLLLSMNNTELWRWSLTHLLALTDQRTPTGRGCKRVTDKLGDQCESRWIHHLVTDPLLGTINGSYAAGVSETV